MTFEGDTSDDVQRAPVVVDADVRVVQAAADLDQEEQGQPERQPAALGGEAAQQLAQVRAVHELHREEVLAVDLAQIEDRHDVGMAEADDELALVDEALDELGVARELRQDLLDDDALLEARRAFHLREIDLAHPAGGEPRTEVIAPERRRFVCPRFVHLASACPAAGRSAGRAESSIAREAAQRGRHARRARPRLPGAACS